ncbi:MAG: hypothetical protein IJM15_03440 [Erysipelotrichaceae bacterium]|nr:hypothetical protein [Erysipelotrichaceae bacterium]
MEKEYDLTTRVEDKPEDCAKRLSYNELIFGNEYYILYNKTLHKIRLIELIQVYGAPVIKVEYLNTEEIYLGEEKEEGGRTFYLINLEEYFPRFYETTRHF